MTRLRFSTRRVLLFLLGLALVFGSTAASARRPGDEPPWVDGTPLLQRLFAGMAPVSPPVPSAPAPAAPPRFQVGHQRNFFAFDFRTNRQYTVPATLRAVGEHSYVYVEDGEWNARVNARTVDRLLTAFEDATPGDPTRGIYEIETAAFGDPPDIDGDPRIVLLLLDIRDNFLPPRGTFVAGFFASVNQLNGLVRDPRYGFAFQSNETEMIYLDTNPLDPGGSTGLGILAHEMQHLIHYAFDTEEEVWVNEGLSDFAMFLTGYRPTVHLERFEAEPNVSLVRWPAGVGSGLPYYGAAYLWMLYLHEQYGGIETIRRIVENRQTGLSGVEAALRGRGVTKSLEGIYADWRVAVVADDPDFGDGRYGFREEEVRAKGRPHPFFPVPEQRRMLSDWAGDLLEFVPVGGEVLPLQVDFTMNERWREAFSLRALLFDGDVLRDVRPIERDLLRPRFADAFEEFGQTASRIVVAVNFMPRAAETVETEYRYTARLGKPIRFTVVAFRDPVQPDYLEFVAVPDSPVEAGTVTIRLTEANGTLEAEMASTDGGRSFGASFRVPSAEANADEWTWEIVHFDQIVGQGTVRLTQ